MRWRANQFHTLLIEDWNEEYTVFQPDSGKTHFFNQMSIQMLIYLDQNPATLEEISTHLAMQFQQTPDNSFLRSIEKVLHHFDTLGLVSKLHQDSRHDDQADSV
ncbi:PqqD family protein, HPr-rel-A system [Nitrosomonas sp. Nm51]|uniref:HPr-rel-A system PqqD family peptide chaperone n=1 Tax=Nitrosomonas sp. Nm51 TaxID=133720 RepID=UPI0008B7CA73|nr:HPr-rel-A system PqqD family peptide chaperone [Nitrosomonas sp. Nm51]SER31231.1 PqqD family protein, HPr-rel-A system [Nitrosomonas sp. Nm51]